MFSSPLRRREHITLSCYSIVIDDFEKPFAKCKYWSAPKCAANAELVSCASFRAIPKEGEACATLTAHFGAEYEPYNLK